MSKKYPLQTRDGYLECPLGCGKEEPDHHLMIVHLRDDHEQLPAVVVSLVDMCAQTVEELQESQPAMIKNMAIANTLLKNSHAQLLQACKALIGPGKHIPFVVATEMAKIAIAAAESLEVKP